MTTSSEMIEEATTSYYAGSHALQPLAKLVQLPVDQINFVGELIATLHENRIE